MSPPLFASIRLNVRPQFYRCEPGWKWAPPPLPDYDLWYVLDGNGFLTIERQRFDLAAGVCFLLGPGSRPNATQNPARRLLVFAVHFDLLDADREPLPPSRVMLPPLGAVVRDAASFSALAHGCEAHARRSDVLGTRRSRLYLEQMLLQLWDEALHPAASPADAQIQQIVRAIHKEPGARWCVDDLARAACLSRSQFTRRFRAVAGMSPAHLVIQTRLERARQLIQETDMTLGQIAHALGYSDTAFFSRQYKRFLGHPPSALRR